MKFTLTRLVYMLNKCWYEAKEFSCGDTTFLVSEMTRHAQSYKRAVKTGSYRTMGEQLGEVYCLAFRLNEMGAHHSDINEILYNVFKK